MNEIESLQDYLDYLIELLEKGLISRDSYLLRIKKISEASKEELIKIINIFRDNEK